MTKELELELLSNNSPQEYINDEACLTPVRLEEGANGNDGSNGLKIQVPDGYALSDSDYFHVDTPSQLRQRFIQIQVVDRRFKEPTWMHPNIGGEAKHIQSSEDEVAKLREELKTNKQNLAEWPSTAISGNAILSSVLFSAGLTTAKGGKLAPVSQVLVVIVVYCFRWVFEEVMSAVPLNGGCYNAILNSSSKKVATIASTFSILSYLATGVVCGVSAVNYMNTLVYMPVVAWTVGLLLAFALLCVIGIAESAVVALIFFTFHTLTLTILAGFCFVYAIQNPSVFIDNMNTGLPDVMIFGEMINSNFMSAIFLSYGPALLSVTGFESSAQFVEEQAPGVLPKALRNMWFLSSVFNVAFSFLALAVVPMDEIMSNKEILLAYMGKISSGYWLEVLVCVDGFMALAGAVLTSYVGINGLLQRLAIDRVLPRFLLTKNSWRNTNHYIILSYFVVASSLVVILNGEVDTLSGVFGFAFIGVMTSFAAGCILLKIFREEIPRSRTTSWPNVIFCLTMVVIGFISNAFGDLTALKYFVIYFVAFRVIILIMLERIRILKGILFISRKLLLSCRGRRGESATSFANNSRGQAFVGSVLVAKTIEKIKKTPVVFFCKAPNLPKINEAISYVMRNEQTYCLRLVHICNKDTIIPREFEDIVCLFDHIYPSIKIDFVSVTGEFDPATIEWISETMAIPTNMMFMRQPANLLIHKVAALGVRVITN